MIKYHSKLRMFSEDSLTSARLESSLTDAASAASFFLETQND